VQRLFSLTASEAIGAMPRLDPSPRREKAFAAMLQSERQFPQRE